MKTAAIVASLFGIVAAAVVSINHAKFGLPVVALNAFNLLYWSATARGIVAEALDFAYHCWLFNTIGDAVGSAVSAVADLINGD